MVFIFDENLTWHRQADDVIGKLSKSLYMMINVKNFLPLHCRKKLYYSFFYSHLSRGILLWGTNISKPYISKLQVKQIIAIRTIMKADYNSSTSHFYKDLLILNVDGIIKLESCKLMYQVSNDKAPDVISQIFKNQQHSHDTRFANDPQYNERRNFAIVYNSFLSTAPQRYSLLPITVRNSTSIESFSKKCKKLFI